MKKINTFKQHHLMAMAAALTLAGAALPTYAGEGHDHGAAPAMANTNGHSAWPMAAFFCLSQPNAN